MPFLMVYTRLRAFETEQNSANAAPLPAGMPVQGGYSPLHGSRQRVALSVLTSRL